MAIGCYPFVAFCTASFPQRFIIVVFCILGVLVARLQQNHTNLISTIYEAYSLDPANESLTEFEWRLQNRDLIIISTGYSLGHFLGQIPAGILADRHSGKWTYFAGIFAGSILTLLNPTILVNRAPWFVVFFIRVLLGLTHSAVFPCVASIVSRWIPQSERGMLGAYAFASFPLFYIIGEFLIFTYTTFYISGGIGLIWCCLCVPVLFDDAEKHPRISVEEKQLLEEKIQDNVKIKFRCKEFFRDKGVWALILGQIGNSLTICLIIKIIHSDLLDMNYTLRRCVITCGFIGLWASGTVSGYFADYCVAKKNWDLKLTRTLMTFLAFLTSNTFLCAAAYCNRHVISTVVVVLVAAVTKGPHYAGHRINHMDLTVNFNGILMAVLNVSEDICGSVISGGYQIVSTQETKSGFRKHVWYTFFVNCGSAAAYFLLARVERAKWDMPPVEQEDV